jgi:hypothetical protein
MERLYQAFAAHEQYSIAPPKEAGRSGTGPSGPLAPPRVSQSESGPEPSGPAQLSAMHLDLGIAPLDGGDLAGRPPFAVAPAVGDSTTGGGPARKLGTKRPPGSGFLPAISTPRSNSAEAARRLVISDCTGPWERNLSAHQIF